MRHPGAGARPDNVGPSCTGSRREYGLNGRKRKAAWVPLAWVFGPVAAVAIALLLTRFTAAEVGPLALTTDFEGRDNVLLGSLFAQAAIVATLVAPTRRRVLRKRWQLVAIGLGLLAIAGLLCGARGVLFTFLLETALVASSPRKGF